MKYHHNPPFIDVKTEVQQGQVACLRSHSWKENTFAKAEKDQRRRGIFKCQLSDKWGSEEIMTRTRRRWDLS